MPTVKKVAPVKKVVVKKTAATSLRVLAKQSRSKVVTSKIATKPLASRNDKLSIPIYSILGVAAGTLDLPKDIFGVSVNQKLLTQAVRVYMTNEKSFTASTKTRGEVHGTTAKIWAQKGTGRARHGAKTAPIFVGGGRAFGPRPRIVKLDLPKKMKKAALLSSLTTKAIESTILAVSGMDKMSGKTKQMVTFLNKVKVVSALIVTDDKQVAVVRAASNIQKITVMPVNMINVYEVLKHRHLIISKEVLAKLVEGLK